MKKLATLFLAAGMIFAASAPASAVDVKVDGQYTFSYQVGSTLNDDTANGGAGNANNYSGATQRLRLGLSFVASENLSGYFQIQNDEVWGNSAHKHGNNNTIRVRQSYMDWIVPGTPVKVRMGRQAFGLPGDAFGKNSIMDGTWGTRDGVVLSAPVLDWLSADAFWVRVDGSNGADKDTSDAFGAVLNTKFDGISASVYGMYATISGGVRGDDSAFGWTTDVVKPNDGDADAYWLGFSSNFTMFDPFTVKLSAAYGAKEYQNEKFNGAYELEKRDGWYVQAKASYKTAFGTPVFGAWYASGDEDDAQYNGQGWIPNMGGRFNAGGAHIVKDGQAGLLCDPNFGLNIAGTWGVQLGIEKVSFLQDLSHDLKVTMFKGTNDEKAAQKYYAKGKTDNKDMQYLSENDTLVEISMANTYKIYKNLSAVLDLAYVITDFEEDDHGKRKLDDDLWRAGLNFIYKF